MVSYETSLGFVLYEELLKSNPDVLIARNNLASLLTDYRQDETSLNQAREVASVLKDSTIPHFRDTYAWIEVSLGKQLEQATDKAVALNTEEEQLGWVKSSFEDIAEARELLLPVSQLWEKADEFVKSHNSWMTGPFIHLRVEPIQEEVDETFRTLKKLSKGFRDEKGEPIKGPSAVIDAVQDKLEQFRKQEGRWTLKEPIGRGKRWQIEADIKSVTCL